jgi:hypothetical protein
LSTYGQQAGVPVEPKAFIGQLRAQLEEAAQQADTGFPENEYLRIENGVPVLKRLHAKPEIDGAKRLEQLLQERTGPIGIIDALIDTEHWLNWTHHFALYPVSKPSWTALGSVIWSRRFAMAATWVQRKPHGRSKGWTAGILPLSTSGM